MNRDIILAPVVKRLPKRSASAVAAQEQLRRIAPLASEASVTSRKPLLAPLSDYTDIELLLLCCLLKNDYCSIRGVGPVFALNYMKAFKSEGSNFTALHQIFPANWSADKRKKCAASIFDALAAFLYQPVYLFSFADPTLSSCHFRDACPTTVIPLPIITHYQHSPSMAWLRNMYATLPQVPTLPAAPAAYSHFGDVACPSPDEMDEGLRPKLTELQCGQIVPACAADGLLPRLTFHTLDQYLQKNSMSLADTFMMKGAQRIDHDHEIEAYLGMNIDDNPDLVLFWANIPQSQNRESYMTRAALRCAPIDGCPWAVLEILEVSCECVIRAARCCQHIAALLVLLTILSTGEHNGPIVTRLPSTWHVKKSAAFFQPGKAVAASECTSLPFNISHLRSGRIMEHLNEKMEEDEVQEAKKTAKRQARLSGLDFDSVDLEIAATLIRTPHPISPDDFFLAIKRPKSS